MVLKYEGQQTGAVGSLASHIDREVTENKPGCFIPEKLEF